MEGWSKKEKTHGHGQLCGDCGEEGVGGGRRVLKRINGNGKNIIKINC